MSEIKSTRRRTEKPAEVDELYEQMVKRGIVEPEAAPTEDTDNSRDRMS